MKKLVLIIILVANLNAFNFPNLSDVIVDNASLLDAKTTSFLKEKLLQNEHNTTNQFVIATINSLENNSIEVYATALFRHWKLGQKDKNNGILLLVAPNERKVRIEVGYGLEGVVTDAKAGYIINYNILPEFKKGNFQEGIYQGAMEILKLLSGDKEEEKPVNELVFFFLFAFFAFFALTIFGRKRKVLRLLFVSILGALIAFVFMFFSSLFEADIFYNTLLIIAYFVTILIFYFRFWDDYRDKKGKFKNIKDHYMPADSGEYSSSSGGGGYSGGGGSSGGGGASGSW